MHVKCDSWPLVLPNDDGIRPAGRADECFYCHQRIGQPHGKECVCVQQKVCYDVTFELLAPCAGYPVGTKLLGKWTTYEPHFWDDDMLHFMRNESSWCAGNCVDRIEWQHPDAKGIVERYASENAERCLCRELEFEIDEILDDGPFVELRSTPPEPDLSPAAR